MALASRSRPCTAYDTDVFTSSELLDEAKCLVHHDHASNRSWNYCWLVLEKIEAEGIIESFAAVHASRPEMWGDSSPSSESVEMLSRELALEWNAALAQLLRYWGPAPLG